MRRVNLRAVGLLVTGLVFIFLYYWRGARSIDSTFFHGGIACACVGCLLVLLSYWLRRPPAR
jgi:hypothetical protein